MITCDKVAVVYLRVSTEEQVESGLGLEAQEAACRAWCTSKGYTVAALVKDPAVSGREHPLNREGFRQVMAELEKRPHAVVVAHSVSRLSRRQSHIWEMLDESGKWGCLRFGLSWKRT